MQIRNQGTALTFFVRSHDSLAFYEENGKIFITPWREVLSYNYQLENFHYKTTTTKKKVDLGILLKTLVDILIARQKAIFSFFFIFLHVEPTEMAITIFLLKYVFNNHLVRPKDFSILQIRAIDS